MARRILGLGHTLTLFIAGALLLALQAEMPPIATKVLQLCVVLLLIGFGVRAIYGARRVPAGPTHTHRTPGSSSFARGSMDARTAIPGGGRSRTGGQRRVDCHRGDHAAVNDDAVGLSADVWRGINRGDGSAVGTSGVADRAPGRSSCVGAQRSLVVGGVSIALGLIWGYPIIGDAL